MGTVYIVLVDFHKSIEYWFLCTTLQNIIDYSYFETNQLGKLFSPYLPHYALIRDYNDINSIHCFHHKHKSGSALFTKAFSLGLNTTNNYVGYALSSSTRQDSNY